MITYKNYLVYCITDKIYGRKYFGVTTRSLADRFSIHLKTLYKSRNLNRRLCTAIRRLGPDNFTISVVKYCDSYWHMLELENDLIHQHNTVFTNYGYNMKIAPTDYRPTEKIRYEPILQLPDYPTEFSFKSIKTMRLLNLNVKGDMPDKMCVFKILIGKKFFIWKAQNIDATLVTLEKGLTTKVKKLPSDKNDLFYLVAEYMRKGRVLNLPVVPLMETADIHELLKFEQEQLDRAKGDPDCLNNSFQVYHPRWVKEMLDPEPESTPHVIVEPPVISRPKKSKVITSKVTAPPFVKKPDIPSVNPPVSNEELVMPVFSAEDIELARVYYAEKKKNAT